VRLDLLELDEVGPLRCRVKGDDRVLYESAVSVRLEPGESLGCQPRLVE
jgi:hypothetical protein